MLALMCGTLTTVGYLGIRKTYISGPFYVVIPLPFLLVWFWRMCNGKYVLLSKVWYFIKVDYVTTENFGL